MKANDQNHRTILKSIAHRTMLERRLLHDFSDEALSELDQPTVAKSLPSDKVKFFVAVEDVDTSVINRLAIEQHLCNNTDSIDKSLENSKIYSAWVHNCTKLAYKSFAEWVFWDNNHRLRQPILNAARLGHFIAYCSIILGVWLMFNGSFSNGLWITIIGLFIVYVKVRLARCWNRNSVSLFINLRAGPSAAKNKLEQNH
jgi:hypothetical protein